MGTERGESMPKNRWNQTTFPGVRYREHPDRKHGLRKDRYFTVRYQKDGKRQEAGLGWASEGWTAESAFGELSKLKKAAVTGEGPSNLREKRQAAEHRKKENAAREITLSAYWERHYLPHAQRTKKKSWDKEESHYRHHLYPFLGDMPLCQIAVRHWDELVGRLNQAGLSARSVEYITGTLRRIMKHAYERGVVSSLPPSGKRIGATAPANNRRMRVILPHEKEALLNFLLATDVHAWRITQFTFLTGCRASEAFGLEWRNVSEASIQFENTKNADSRKIPIGTSLKAVFDSLERGRPTDRVFLNKKGMSYTSAPPAFKTAVRNLELNAERERLDRISFHSIRHTVATELAKHLDLRSLMDIMGWRVPAMALRYMHGNEDATLTALEKLG